MALEDIRREDVLKAIAEFDRIGRKEFLRKYDFGPTRRNWFSYNGKFYDAHPIVGVAHGFATGEFWTKARWFYAGGTSIADGQLQNVGFYTVGGNLYPLENLKADFSHGKRAPYQYVVLLWALARTLDGKPRLVAFTDVRDELAELLAPFALTDSVPNPAMPWAALGNSVGEVPDYFNDLWDVDSQGLTKLTDSDVKRLNIVGGLSARQFNLAEDPRYISAAVEIIRRFIGDEPAFPGLLERLGINSVPGPAGDSPEVEDVTAAVEEIANPRKRFGRRLSAAENKAIEERAVDVVRKHYEEVLGYATEDVGATKSYDVHATKDGAIIKVEVKGTTSDGAEIVLTANEVALHLAEHPDTALAVVRKIVLDRSGDTPVGTGGELKLMSGWELDESRLKPIAYRYSTGL